MQLGSDLYYCTSWLLYMFGCFLHPSSGVQQLYMQPLAQVHIGRSSSYVAEFKLCHVGRRSSDVYLCQRLHIQLLYSWWWVQEAPETCRVVKKCSNKDHCPAASCWFIKYWYVTHGTMNLKNLIHTRKFGQRVQFMRQQEDKTVVCGWKGRASLTWSFCCRLYSE